MTRKQIIKNKELKQRIVQISYDLKLSHIGSCLVAVDLIEEIYRTKKPDEKFVLSSGHAHLAHAAVMEKYGFFPPTIEKLAIGWPLKQGNLEWFIQRNIHCDRLAGCDVSTGSLGHGIGIAVGMALADRSKNVYCVISDGESREGSVWEALRIQKEQHLDNLHVYCLINGYGAYHEINGMQLSNQLEYVSWCKSVFVNMGIYPKWLQTQEAHYGILDKKRYDELMEILK